MKARIIICTNHVSGTVICGTRFQKKRVEYKISSPNQRFNSFRVIMTIS